MYHNLPGGAVDFGVRPVFNGHSAPVPDATRRFLAWFERSSAERRSATEGELAEGSGGFLDRLREMAGLVYNGEGDNEL